MDPLQLFEEVNKDLEGRRRRRSRSSTAAAPDAAPADAPADVSDAAPADVSVDAPADVSVDALADVSIDDQAAAPAAEALPPVDLLIAAKFQLGARIAAALLEGDDFNQPAAIEEAGLLLAAGALVDDI